MPETIKITCPECRNILVVEKKSGKVLEVRKPLLEESTGDRFKDAFLRVKGSQERAEQKFREAQEREREKKSKLDSLFSEKLKEVQEKGDDDIPPERPFDLD